MTDRPFGSLQSGEFAHKLWTEGEIYLYSYNKGKRSFRLKLFNYGNHKCYCTDIIGGNDVMREFDLSGFFITMNDPKWGTVVFDNFWHAYAYEQKLKQTA